MIYDSGFFPIFASGKPFLMKKRIFLADRQSSTNH